LNLETISKRQKTPTRDLQVLESDALGRLFLILSGDFQFEFAIGMGVFTTEKTEPNQFILNLCLLNKKTGILAVLGKVAEVF